MRAPAVLLLHGVGSSADTWWRVEEDLTELGWEPLALDLPGHGDRPLPPNGLRSLADLADDALAQLDGRRFDLVVGHSLGAVVALELVAGHPEVTDRVVVVDPPALGGTLTVDAVADDLVAQAAQAHSDVEGLVAALAASNPRWSATDAEVTARNSLRVDAAPVAEFLRRQTWDLVALMGRCPVPLGLVAAEGAESTLVEPARSQVMAALAPEQLVVVRGGHGVHRERPALFLLGLLRLAGADGTGPGAVADVERLRLRRSSAR